MAPPDDHRDFPLDALPPRFVAAAGDGLRPLDVPAPFPPPLPALPGAPFAGDLPGDFAAVGGVRPRAGEEVRRVDEDAAGPPAWPADLGGEGERVPMAGVAVRLLPFAGEAALPDFDGVVARPDLPNGGSVSPFPLIEAAGGRTAAGASMAGSGSSRRPG